MSELVLAPSTIVVSAGAPPAASPPPSAVAKRAQSPLLVVTWSLAALAPQLPLRFPVDPDLPPSPKRRYRSAYLPPDPTALRERDLTTLRDFDLAVEQIDFSPLERALAAHYQPSQKGQVPYHPVSLFLAIALRRDRGWSWAEVARVLAHPEEGAVWRTRCGFTTGATPSASGLRHFFHAVGPEVFAALCPEFITLLRTHGLFPERSTYPDDPPDRGITVCQDGMLHPARHQACCHLATATCYQPLAEPGVAPSTPDAAPASPAGDAPGTPSDAVGPGPTVGRPCRAREHHVPGCTCASAACQTQCQRASRLDPEARFIHYAGRARPDPAAGSEPAPAAPAGPTATATGPRTTTGTNVFGYRSVAERALDDRFAVAWTLRSRLYPASTDERTIFADRVAGLRRTFPDLTIGEWLDDAGVGFARGLDAIWELGALRMVDLRADPSDRDPAACLARGYDGQGRPLCPHGYPLRANGYDHARRRAKYVCAQACRRQPLQEGTPIQEVVGCPYLDPSTPGFVVNVGRTLPDGSVRLAREIPYGSDTWQARYGRRNLAESRNGQLAGMGLKRLRAYGTARNTKEVQLADFLLNLRTLGRLVRQATTRAPR